MTIDFLIDENGYIIKDSLPIDSNGKITSNTTLLPVNYEWDDIKNMIRPKYNLITKIFEDEGIDYNYLIDQMNTESNPILKEEWRMKAVLILRFIAFFRLWKLNENYNNKWNSLNDIMNSVESNVDTLIFRKIPQGMLYKKSPDDYNNETQLTTYQVISSTCVEDNQIVFRKSSDDFLYKKSINDIDNETQLTTYPTVYNVVSIGNEEIAFIKSVNNFLYKKSINDLDNETPLTTYDVYNITFVGNDEIVFTKNDRFLYKKSINDIDNETQLTTYSVHEVVYVGNNQIIFRMASNDFIYKKLIDNIDNETQITDFIVFGIAYLGNNEIAYIRGTNQFIYRIPLDNIYNFLQLSNFGVDYFSSNYIPVFFYNNTFLIDYNNQKIDLINFIKEINNIIYDTTTELNAFYSTTQTLRDKYKIYALENISDIQDIYDNDRLWLEQMSNILGVE